MAAHVVRAEVYVDLDDGAEDTEAEAVVAAALSGDERIFLAYADRKVLLLDD